MTRSELRRTHKPVLLERAVFGVPGSQEGGMIRSALMRNIVRVTSDINRMNHGNV